MIAWFAWAFLALAPTALLTLVLRLDLHRRFFAWRRAAWRRVLKRSAAGL
jgi:hypothetical protein